MARPRTFSPWQDPPTQGANARPEGRVCFVEPSVAARRLLWHVFAIFYSARDRPDYHPASNKPGAYLTWIPSGEGELRLPNGTLHLRPGNVVWLVDMRLEQAYVPKGSGLLRMAGFRFSGAGLDAWLELLTARHGPEIELENATFLRSAQRELIRLAQHRPPGWEWHVHFTVNNVLGRILLASGVLTGSLEELPPAMARVLDAIAAEPLRDWRATELAAAAGVSYSRLRELFHLAGQGTIHQHIQKLRLDRARLLLTDQRLSIKDVASQMHFSSEFYFSHFFKNLTGMSPRHFRDSLQAGTRTNRRGKGQRKLQSKLK